MLYWSKYIYHVVVLTEIYCRFTIIHYTTYSFLSLKCACTFFWRTLYIVLKVKLDPTKLCHVMDIKYIMLSSILSFLVLSVLFNDLVRCCGYTVPCVNLTTLSVAKVIQEGADKSLDRPGSKQATATKLGIYSTYSPRSPIHFLDRLQIRRLSVQPGLLGSIDLHVGRKMMTFQLFFQSREQAVVRRGLSSL
jgi:hypothetical protein